MKKIFSFMFVIAFMFVLLGCEDKEDPNTNTGNTASISGVSDITLDFGATFDPYAGVSATDTVDGDFSQAEIEIDGAVNTSVAGTYTLTYSVTGSDGNKVEVIRIVIVNDQNGEKPAPTEIIMMGGLPEDVDPFNENYTGAEVQAKRAAQLDVEERLNVDIVYQAYPASAAWGPSRVTAIINASVAGDPLADIYMTSSDWISQLADGDAIVPVDDYMADYGQNIDDGFVEIGSYKDHFYGFGANKLTVDGGLYYNADLIASLGVENPTQIFLDGNWNWTKFDSWLTGVQTAMTALGEDYYALGGVPSAYAEPMVPLNGGSLINATTGRVSFAQTPALETYTFLSDLWNKGLFEPAGQYDSGSPLWQTGKVAMHPGSLWFVTSDIRWGGLSFELGYVPFPVSDDFEGDYVSPMSGVAVYNLASGMSPEREALVFRVWNELQLWKTEQELEDEFELSLLTKFDEEIYVEAYMQVYDSIYLELIHAIGLSSFGENGWRTNVNVGVKEGTSRTEMDRIEPIYRAALEAYLS